MKLLMENWRRFLTEEEENTSPEERPPAEQQGTSWETWTIAELEDLINRYLSEFDINTFTIMGALQEKIIEMSQLGNFDMEIPLDDEEEEK